MKTGDKIYCKRDKFMYHPYNNGKNKRKGKKLNNQGSIYEIHKIGEDRILVTTDLPNTICEYDLLNEKPNRYFFNFFYNQQEYRKLKLEKLNEKR